MRCERRGRTYDQVGEGLVGVAGGRIWRPPRRLERRVRVPKSGGVVVSDVDYGVEEGDGRGCIAYRCARRGISCGRLRVEVASSPSGLGHH